MSSVRPLVLAGLFASAASGMLAGCGGNEDPLSSGKKTPAPVSDETTTAQLTKAAVGKALPSVVEIWLVDSERRWVQIWWREAEGWHGRDHVGGGSFASAVLDGAVPLDELYLNAGL